MDLFILILIITAAVLVQEIPAAIRNEGLWILHDTTKHDSGSVETSSMGLEENDSFFS